MLGNPLILTKQARVRYQETKLNHKSNLTLTMNSPKSKNLPPQAEPTSHCLQLPVKGDAKIHPGVTIFHV